MDANVDIYIVLSLLAFGLGAFFLLYLITSRRYHTFPNLLIAAVIFALCFEIWNDALIQSKFIYEFPWFFNLSGKLKLFIFSSLLIYTLLITGKTGRFNKLLLLIYVPYVIDFFVWQRGFFWFSIEQKLKMIDMFYADLRPGPMNIWRMPWVAVVSFFVPGIYLSVAVYKLILYRKLPHIRDKVSFKIFMALLISAGLYVLLSNALANLIYKITGLSIIDLMIDLIWMSFIILIIAFFIMKQIEIDREPTSSDLAKYRNSNLKDDRLASILDQLQTLMVSEKRYLDPELSLGKLSDELAVNSAYLSRSVNEGLDLRLTDFINSYRVAASKVHLANSDNDVFTIEAIAHKSGFRSKSAFYRAFQKETGISPSDYKKQIRG